MFNTDRVVLAPQLVFGGDTADRVASGNMEGIATNGIAPGWIISATPGHGVTATINTGVTHGGTSAQNISWATTADGTIGFAQQLNGLDTNNTYGATAWVEILTLSASQLNDLVFRVGPASGSTNYQASATASNTAAFQQLIVTWSNTASSVWLWFTTIRRNNNDVVLSGSMEGGYINGVAPGWSVSAGGITATVETTTVHAGTSAQRLAWDTNANGTQAFARNITNLVPNQNYSLSANIRIPTSTAVSDYVVTLRVGPNSGGANFQASSSAVNSATASFSGMIVNWTNTASNVWVWVTASYTGSTSSMVANGDMEAAYTNGIEAGWIISPNSSLSAQANGTIVHGGVSSQLLAFKTAASGVASFAQNVAGLSTNHNYSATAWVRTNNLSAFKQHNLVFRVGPNSGAGDWQASATASDSSTAAYQALVLSWANTATSVWVWVTDDFRASTTNIISNSGFEGAYNGGFANSWSGSSSGITGSVETTIIGLGVSAQRLAWDTNANETQIFTQNLTGLSSLSDYSVTVSAQLASLNTSGVYDTYIRLGPNSGGKDWTNSMTASNTAALQTLTTTVNSSANSIWMWVGSRYKGNTTNQIANGTFESTFTNGLAASWLKSSNGLIVQRSTAPYSGTQAQELIFSSTADETEALSQNITGLTPWVSYAVSAYINFLASTTALQMHKLMLRVGPNSGAKDFQASTTATVTGAYTNTAFSWTNTATSLWIWVTDTITPETAIVGSGTFENGFTNGIGNGWISTIRNYAVSNIVSNSGFQQGFDASNVASGWVANATITASITSGAGAYEGLSAQVLRYPLNSTSTSAFATNLTGLDVYATYSLSALLRIENLNATNSGNGLAVTLAIKANSADSGSITSNVLSVTGATYTLKTVNWTNTASNVWVTITNANVATACLVYLDAVSATEVTSFSLSGAGTATPVNAGSSSQQIRYVSNVGLSSVIAQQLTSLSTSIDYAVSAFVYVEGPTAGKVVMRVGPNSGGTNWQASTTSTVTAAYEKLSLTWANTASTVWVWLGESTDNSVTAYIDTVTGTFVKVNGPTAQIDSITLAQQSVTGGVILDDFNFVLNGITNTSYVDDISFSLVSPTGGAIVDAVSALMTGSSTGGGIIDDVSAKSLSANIMQSTNTATNFAYINTNAWTMIIPNGTAAPASGTTFILQVNNSNPFDEAKAGHYVHPTNFSFKPTSNASGFNQASASATDFEGNWISVGDITASAYVGNGAYRWIRIYNAGGFTGSASAFRAFVWTPQFGNVHA